MFLREIAKRRSLSSSISATQGSIAWFLFSGDFIEESLMKLNTNELVMTDR